MSRNSGIGLVSLGILLGIVGAILRFATSVHTSGFNIHKIGDILLLGGIVAFVVGLVILAMGARSGRTTGPEISEAPSDQPTGERDDWGRP
jgi:hypothetical protein